jgi:ribosome biogenesis GTPase
LCVSAHTGAGIRELKEEIRGKCVCFTGQSAVGKSSLLNVIDDSLRLEVGGMSKKTARGRHTTRTTALLYIPELDTYALDTPGFSMFVLKADAPQAEIAHAYREFGPYADGCRFASCAHGAEPDCAVKDAVQRGEIDQRRYERYLRVLDER